MSGHSKWAQIHRQKEVTDQKKGALFTKLGNAITIAAKEGGENSETNFKLKLAIDQAKTANMPRETIKRAIKRGTGELKGEKIEQVTYEGFGPGKTALIIEVLTDNRNRSNSTLKHILSKYGGHLAKPNSIKWLFEPKGVIRILPIEEEKQLEIIDVGVGDIFQEGDHLVIYCQPNDLKKIKEFLEKKGIEIKYAELEMIAKEKIPTTDPNLKTQLEKLFTELDENPEINNYYTNAQ